MSNPGASDLLQWVSQPQGNFRGETADQPGLGEPAPRARLPGAERRLSGLLTGLEQTCSSQLHVLWFPEWHLVSVW